MSYSNIPPPYASHDTSLPPPLVYPNGLRIDNFTIASQLASTKQIHRREPVIYENQLILDEIPTNPNYVRISPPSTYQLNPANDIHSIERNIVYSSNDEQTKLANLSDIVERFTLLRLEYVDGKPPTTTNTPQAFTRYDNQGIPLLLKTIPPINGVRTTGYEIRLFLVPTAVSLEDLSNQYFSDTITNIQQIDQYELDNYDETYPWILDSQTGIVTFVNEAPSLTTHNLFLIFTRYIGTNTANNIIRQGIEFPSQPIHGSFFFNTSDNFLYRFNGSMWNRVNDINADQNLLLDYLTNQPPRYEDVSFVSPSLYGTGSIDLNAMDVIGKQLNIVKGIYYEDGEEAENRKQWVFDASINLPFVVETVVQARPHESTDAFQTVLHLGTDVSQVVLRGGLSNPERSFILTQQGTYDFRIYPRNNVNKPVNSFDVFGVKLISDEQLALIEGTETSYDLSLQIQCPYPLLREQGTTDGLPSDSILPQRYFRLHTTTQTPLDISMVYVNSAQPNSVKSFINAWNKYSTNAPAWTNQNKLYANVGYLGDTVNDASNITVVYPFASVLRDYDVAVQVSQIHGRVADDICANFLAEGESTRRIQLMNAGIWGGILNKNNADDIYNEGGHWGSNVLEPLRVGISYHGFTDASKVDGSFSNVGTSHDRKYVSFNGVRSIDSFQLLNLPESQYAEYGQNTLLGAYSMTLGYNDEEQSIFFVKDGTGEGVYTNDVSGNSEMIGLYEPSLLPYYLGVIVEGYGVDGNLSGLPEKSQFIFAQRVMVDYLKGNPSMNTFVSEYNMVKPLQYDAPLIAWCCGVPSLVGMEFSFLSEVGNVCGTVLPAGGKVAEYRLLPTVAVQTSGTKYMTYETTWYQDVSSSVVSDTFDTVVDNLGTPYVSKKGGEDVSSVLVYFGDTIITSQDLPVMETKMYSMNAPDGVVDYGTVPLLDINSLGGVGFIHSDARSFVGNQSQTVGEILYDAVNDTNPNRYERVGEGGIRWQPGEQPYTVISIAQDIWKTTTETGKWILAPCDFEQSGLYSHETPIAYDQLLFYGGAFTNQYGTIKRTPYTQLNGNEVFTVEENYTNPYVIASQVWEKYLGNDGLLTRLVSPSYIESLRQETANVANYASFQTTGSQDIVDNDNRAYKWITKRFRTTTSPGREFKKLRLNGVMDSATWVDWGWKVYTKQRLFLRAVGDGVENVRKNGENTGLGFKETSWFKGVTDENTIDLDGNLFVLMNQDEFPDGSSNVYNNVFVFATNTNNDISNVYLGDRIDLQYGYSEIFVRIGIPVSDANESTLWDFELYDAYDIENKTNLEAFLTVKNMSAYGENTGGNTGNTGNTGTRSFEITDEETFTITRVVEETNQVKYGSLLNAQSESLVLSLAEDPLTSVRVVGDMTGKLATFENIVVEDISCESGNFTNITTNKIMSSTGNNHYETRGDSKLIYPPTSNLTVNGVNISVLNKRTRTNYGSAKDCLNIHTQRVISDNDLSLIIWCSELLKYYVLGNDELLISDDGINWNNKINFISSMAFKSICWSPELYIFCFVGVGNEDEKINVYLIDPKNNNELTSYSTNINQNEKLYSVCWSPELQLFCAVGFIAENNQIISVIRISSDGINWNNANINCNQEFYSICWSPELSLFCVCSITTNDDIIFISSDGENWIPVCNFNNKCHHICWSPELSLFCISVWYSTSMLISSDGINWTYSAPLGIDELHNISSICWSPELSIFYSIYVYNSNIYYLSSVNGVDWHNHIIDNLDRTSIGNRIISICWSPELSMFSCVSKKSIITTGIGIPNSKNTLKTLPSQMRMNPDGILFVSNSIDVNDISANTGNFNQLTVGPTNINIYDEITNNTTDIATLLNQINDRLNTINNNFSSLQASVTNFIRQDLNYIYIN